MKKVWIEDWKQIVGSVGLKDRTTGHIDQNKPGYVRLQGATTTSESFRVAINFGLTKEPEMTIVLFVISL